MSAIKRYWIDFAAWVKGRNRPLPEPQLIPVTSWADHKLAYAHAQKAHRGQADAYESLRKATKAKLVQQIISDENKCLRLVDTHRWLISDPDVFVALVKATARRRVMEASR